MNATDLDPVRRAASQALTLEFFSHPKHKAAAEVCVAKLRTNDECGAKNAALALRAMVQIEDSVELNEDEIVEVARAYVATSMALDKINVERLPFYGETAASREFARRHVDNFRFVPEWGRWLWWDGRRWCNDTSRRARLACKVLCDDIAQQARNDQTFGREHSSRERSAQKFEQRKYVDAVLDLATVEPELVVHAAQLDADNFLLNTPAGTVDLRMGAMRPHDRADCITKLTRVSPAEGEPQRFNQFMADITMNDVALVDYLQRALGACLSGAIQDHWLMFWYGAGRNGKNTLGDLIAESLGDYAKSVPTQTLMADAHGNRHPTEVANLFGLRLAISSEVAEGEHWNESKLKELTGDAMLSARFMRQDFFEFRRTHKHLVFGNHRPILRIVDPAMAARLHIVPFNATFSADNGTLDPLMPAKLREEAPQILSWLIAGHEKWREDGTLRRCAAVVACTKDYLDSQATLEQWVDECLDVVSDDGRAGRGWLKSGELYASYSSWKKERGEHPLSQTRWGEQIGRRFRVVTAAGRRVVGVMLKEGTRTW